MGELSTYSLTDFVPFTREVYLRLFVRLNEAYWPAQLAALALGIGAVWSARRGRGRPLGLLLALCWAWVGYAFHLRMYANLNWAATYIGWGFLGQAVLLAAVGATGGLDRPNDEPPSTTEWIGIALGAVAVLGFPLLSLLMGRGIRGAEVFGIAPDPTALGTLGLTLAAARPPWHAWIVPLLWCLISGLTSWAIGTSTGLITAAGGGVAAALALRKHLR